MTVCLWRTALVGYRTADPGSRSHPAAGPHRDRRRRQHVDAHRNAYNAWLASLADHSASHRTNPVTDTPDPAGPTAEAKRRR